MEGTEKGMLVRFLHREGGCRRFPTLNAIVLRHLGRGGAGLRPRWRDRRTGRIYEWDSRHGTVEVFDRQGRHIGEFHPSSGKQLKDPNPNYRVDP